MNTILFDMDGTLFDTEKHYQWAWRKAIADAGYELDASEVLKLRSFRTCSHENLFSTYFLSAALVKNTAFPLIHSCFQLKRLYKIYIFVYVFSIVQKIKFA